jgi:hypothetical protein
MNKTLNLSDSEWQVVEELLRQEQNELPAEIHHTDSPSLGDELQKRQALVAAILDRMTKARSTERAETRVGIR